MASEPGATSAAMLLRATAAFRDLTDEQLAEIAARANVHHVLRGDVLVVQGAASRSIYVVVSGLFEVWIEGQDSAISEIGVGEPIGEIGFFAGIARTATIIAARDSAVLELDAKAFEEVARKVPSIYPTLMRTLARRLADANTRIVNEPRSTAARTVVVIAGGSEPIPRAFYDRFGPLIAAGGGLVLTLLELGRRFSGQALDGVSVSGWLNAIEQQYGLICYVAEGTLNDWTRKAIRQADQVLIVVSG